MRPIEAAPGPERNLAVFDMGLKPVAVELDLVQPSVSGGRRLDSVASIGSTKPGRGALTAPSIADASRDFAPMRSRFGLPAAPAPSGFSIFPVFDDQPGASPSSSSIVRPVLIDSGRSSRISASSAERANSSSPLMRSQFSRFSPGLPCILTRCQRPLSFWPCSSNSRWPFFKPLCASPIGAHVPLSQTMTAPPPYSPLAIVPSKSAYSSGWSSTATARRFSPGFRLGPRVTAQLLRTPSSARRKS